MCNINDQLHLKSTRYVLPLQAKNLQPADGPLAAVAETVLDMTLCY